MIEQLPHTGHAQRLQMPEIAHHDGHAAHEEHEGQEAMVGPGLMMIACCIPMLVIVGILVFTGVPGSGAILYAVLCTTMMALMMFAMPGGHRH